VAKSFASGFTGLGTYSRSFAVFRLASAVNDCLREGSWR
jgi:hypothetical protein